MPTSASESSLCVFMSPRDCFFPWSLLVFLLLSLSSPPPTQGSLFGSLSHIVHHPLAPPVPLIAEGLGRREKSSQVTRLSLSGPQSPPGLAWVASRPLPRLGPPSHCSWAWVRRNIGSPTPRHPLAGHTGAAVPPTASLGSCSSSPDPRLSYACLWRALPYLLAERLTPLWAPTALVHAVIISLPTEHYAYFFVFPSVPNPCLESLEAGNLRRVIILPSAQH